VNEINTKLNVGIIGCGIIGDALRRWISDHNPDCNILISDPPKGINEDISKADIFFISIHIPTEPDNTQNLVTLKVVIKSLPDKPIFIRTTLVPGTTDMLKKKYNRNIYFMPEFLRERTAYEDFCTQAVVFCGEIELLKRIFIGKDYLVMSSLEAEISKYAHNVFCSLKVTYFNGIFELAERNNCEYEKIRKGLLVSGNINERHTVVPGYDGQFGYGGKCFPKDVNEFMQFTDGSMFGEMIKMISAHNEYYVNKK